ncbi:hypothetical protein [Blastococcus saxobsidens]|uniref:DUF4386 family protein n=1 Tax=Blastococcus saxobsidens (strain DD2) TaxID=1146883 RepID=H6RKR4_BLASD|nr:hypothetical protein [Blastococcus saxobsidens]CCG03680.1 conserved membrane protein of unknown function [Blastococcus saxobsidens DD2]
MSTVNAIPVPSPGTATSPPFSRSLRMAAGCCLIAGALLNGLPQLIGHALTGDLSFSEQIVWATEHPLAHRAEQTALLVSSLFLVPGLLGVAHVCRFRAPVLTAFATPLVVWGMWGFTNVLATGYVAGTVAPTVLPVDQAVALSDALSGHPGTVAAALVPHLLGSFPGLVLLGVAVWRSGAFPRPAAVLLVGFLVWDFLLPPLGPVGPHLLLVISWIWLGSSLIRMPTARWRGVMDGAR